MCIPQLRITPTSPDLPACVNRGQAFWRRAASLGDKQPSHSQVAPRSSRRKAKRVKLGRKHDSKRRRRPQGCPSARSRAASSRLRVSANKSIEIERGWSRPDQRLAPPQIDASHGSKPLAHRLVRDRATDVRSPMRAAPECMAWLVAGAQSAIRHEARHIPLPEE
jgi:hypothetical protein